ncbi:MAG: GC-type dockerin domain-anchored protein [Phycisphaerales bacterium JB039]
MNLSMTLVAGCVAACGVGAAAQTTQVEDFDGGTFSNPFFQHALESAGCCWEFDDRLAGGDWTLHLFGNGDTITFDTAPGQQVSEFSLLIYDTQSGITGRPVTGVEVVGASGDSVLLSAAVTFEWELLSATSDTPGGATGLPIGPIVEVYTYAGSSSDGAYYDLLRAEVVDGGCYADCDGSGALDFFDFLCFQNAFGAGAPEADCDGSGALDFFDFLCFQNEFAAGCF